MPQVKPKVTLLEYTPNPERTVALAAKLCYSDATIENLQEGLDKSDINKFYREIEIFRSCFSFRTRKFYVRYRRRIEKFACSNYKTQNSVVQR